MVVVAALWLAMQVPTAAASTGGPELTEPLGWNPTSHEVFFRIFHVDESGEAPTVVRLSLDGKSRRFEALKWSVETLDDSTYRMYLRRLSRRLRPLRERLTTTIPETQEVALIDTIEGYGGRWERFRARVRWFNGACEGTVEAITYRDPSLRMIRLYQVPERTEMIGLFSFLGIAHESGYEAQVPALLPSQGVVLRIEALGRARRVPGK